MQFNDRELIIFWKPDQKKDKNTLNLAKQVSNHIRDIDVYTESVTATQLTEILGLLNLPIEKLIEKESDEYKKNFQDKDLEDTEWIKAMTNKPELIKTPIVFLGKKGMIIETPSNVLSLDPNHGYNSLKQ
jgi:arsenate reductase